MKKDETDTAEELLPDDNKNKHPMCGVTENEFPYINCFFGAAQCKDISCGKKCPYYNEWTSLPDSVTLATTHIYECLYYGYLKRVRKPLDFPPPYFGHRER